jgi:hypothetical protein
VGAFLIGVSRFKPLRKILTQVTVDEKAMAIFGC